MNWLVFAILSATSFGFYNFFVKMAVDKLNPVIAAVFITGAAFIVAVVAMLTLKTSGQTVVLSKDTLFFPILAGVFAGFAEILYLFMFSSGASITIGNPLVVGGTVFVTVVLGLVILKEPMTIIKGLGIILILGGLVLLVRS